MHVFGFLNIDKPTGMTSHDVVAAVRRGTGVKKVGHAGTLDPMATGVLVVCLGPATRLSEYAMHHDKTYQATVRLGIQTDTYDAEGQVVARDPRPVSRDQVEAVLPRFRGAIQQVPPMYSAIKKGGKKLYELARAGQEVEREARPVTIRRLELLAWDYPHFILEVECSAGTYIRSLAHDIGQTLEVGAHLAALRRTRSGTFHSEEAVPFDRWQAAVQAGTWPEYLLPPDQAIQHLPRLDLDAEQAKIVQNGGFIPHESPVALVRAYDPNGHLLALLEPYDKAPGQWKPRKVFR